MLYSDSPRVHYDKPQLAEVICQLRFPAILSIGAKDPVDFQDAVRGMFPRYAAREEQPGARITGMGTPNAKLESPKPVTNHNFISADGRWKLNLTSAFISLSTVAYPGWEDFGKQLDLPLAQFIHIYKPAFFERIGLRYVNAISRRTLGLEELLWDDLIQQPYLGILGEPDVEETDVVKCSVDIETALAGNCRMKIHAGPGMLQSGKGDREVRFILDGDFSTSGNLSTEQVPDRLEELHRYAVRLFRGAITNTLHDAMGPTPL